MWSVEKRETSTTVTAVLRHLCMLAGWLAGWLRSDDQQLIRQLKLLQGTKVHNRVGGERETIYLGINLDNGGVNSITYCLGKYQCEIAD
jgi:hypothetical protein